MFEWAETLSPIYSPIYDRILRNRLPRKYAVLNGVVTKSVRLLDPVDHYPNHKQANIEQIKALVQPDDTVVEIGTGYGACTVWAARKAVEGHVISYEGSKEMIDVARDAVRVNSHVDEGDFEDRIEIHHAIVGESEEIWGDQNGAKQMRPDEIPECDVLISDCEGSELDIVSEMDINPRVAIVETHPQKASPTDAVVDELCSKGYETTIYPNTEVDLITAQQ